MAKWQNIASLIILQDDNVLMRETAQGWQLPSYEDVSFYSGFHIWLRRVNDDLDGDFSIVRRVWGTRDDEQKINHQWFYMENNNAQWIPPNTTKWIVISALDKLDFANEIEKEHLPTMLKGIQQSPHELTPEFMRTGWFAMMRDWVSQKITTQGYTLIREPELFKLNNITSLLRTETEQCVFYAKVENQNYPIFCNEAQTLQALHQIAPQVIPDPIAIHPDNGMGIYADFGSTVEDSNIDDPKYKEVILAFADLQKQTIDKVDELISIGCADRRLNRVTETFRQLIADKSLESSLTPEMHSQLVSQKDKILAYCDELASYDIPYTLSHGDFHEGNIALTGDTITFFDWTDACVAHPFLDMYILTSFKPPHRDDSLFNQLEELYLSCWSQYETPENIKRAYGLSKIASALHQIISYQTIHQYSPPMYQWDFAWGVPQFTKSLLEQLELLNESA